MINQLIQEKIYEILFFHIFQLSMLNISLNFLNFDFLQREKNSFGRILFIP